MPTSGATCRVLMMLTALGVTSTIVRAWPNESYKFVAPDGSMEDRFGECIAVGEGLLLVGAPGDDDRGANSGSVYIFELVTGDLLRKLTPSDGQAGDQFGKRMAMADGVAIIGAVGDDDLGVDVGSAYLFDVHTGEQLFKLLPDNSVLTQYMGYTVAIGEGYAVLGAPMDSEYVNWGGAAWLFDVATGEQLFKLHADIPTGNADFGSAAAIAEGKVLIGSRYAQFPGWNELGAVYYFDPLTGEQVMKVWPAGEDHYVALGWSMDVSNGVMIVGSFNSDSDYWEYGSAYLFDLDSGAQLHKVEPVIRTEEGHFGAAVAIEGALALVGEPGQERNGVRCGSAMLYDVSTGALLADLHPDELFAGDLCGTSVALSDGVAFVGSPGRDDVAPQSGAVYVFGDIGSICRPDMNDDGTLDFADVQSFLSAFAAHDPAADFAGPLGLYDFFDVQAFLNAFSAGCP